MLSFVDMSKVRKVREVITAHRQLEGGGFVVRRPFPSAGARELDPFLLLDEMGPASYAPGEAVGAPDHPHRGFETVTYLLSGEMQHADSAGHRGRLGPGDVQWMTAGRGVVHSELPSDRIMREGGKLHGFQIWVNLPAREKLIAPHYQEISRERLPSSQSDDGLAKVRVIAGEALGAKAVIETRTPILLQDWTLDPGASVEVAVPSEFSVYAYVFENGASAGDGTALEEGQLAIFGEGDAVRLARGKQADTSGRLLLLGGVPLREPVARYGPFVMNTESEIRQAISDFRRGAF